MIVGIYWIYLLRNIMVEKGIIENITTNTMVIAILIIYI
jgi:hypothetical protein